MKIIKKIAAAAIAVTAMTSLSSCNYNSLVEKQQGVDRSWGAGGEPVPAPCRPDPQTLSTQSRLLPPHEEETLSKKVTEARAKAASITLSADDLTEENLARYQEAQNELSGALLKSLRRNREAYPDLKANQEFPQSPGRRSSEGTENRISTERMRYTEAVRDYNTAIKKFPTVIYAGWFGFRRNRSLKAEAGAEKAPEVKF